ncbi:MAG: hypothetical protein O3A46_05130 [Candidatus Poribacteria bacterium]|nr:hypothetical protein [Candidatus Poribacteria bacterium]
MQTHQPTRLDALSIVFALIAWSVSAFAVTEFKVSQYDGGHQIWFEAEAFDERSPNENYKLGDAENALKPTDGAFGDIVTNAGGSGWLLYRFDISIAKGSAGPWRFIGRVINPSNASDWLWVLGDDGDEIPQVAPAFIRPDHIIFENDAATWTWVWDGDFGADGGTINELKNGENVMMIWTRGSNLTDQYDVFTWADDPLYRATDDDYINAVDKDALYVDPTGKTAVVWGSLKRE